MHRKILIQIILVIVFLCIGCVYFSRQSRLPASVKTFSYGAYSAEVTSRQLLAWGRAAFVSRDYKIASHALFKLLKKYPHTGYIEEASALLAKVLFYDNQLDESAKVIQKLYNYNPHSRSEHMGDALLTLAQIYQQRGQMDSAIQFYRKVITQFQLHRGLVHEAEDLLLKISL